MEITEEWLRFISDDRGLTPGQVNLLAIWKRRQAYVGFNRLPPQVATFIEGCKGYRGIPASVAAMLK